MSGKRQRSEMVDEHQTGISSISIATFFRHRRNSRGSSFRASCTSDSKVLRESQARVIPATKGDLRSIAGFALLPSERFARLIKPPASTFEDLPDHGFRMAGLLRSIGANVGNNRLAIQLRRRGHGQCCELTETGPKDIRSDG